MSLILHPAPRAHRILALAAACFWTASAASAQQTPPPMVVVAPAEMTSVQNAATFTGRLVAAQQVQIRARVTGFLQSITFEEGSRVTAGTELFHIEDDTYAAALQQVEGQIQSAQAQKTLAELERDRQQELVSRQASPRRNLDQAVANLGDATGQLVTLEAQARQAALNLSYTSINAPFDGVVGLTQYDVGALVSPSTGPLVTLTRTDPIFAQFAVPTRVVLDYRDRVDRGEAPEVAEVSLQLANGSSHDRLGKVTFVDSEVAEGTDTILLRAVFDNPEGRLRNGEFVVVRLTEAASNDVLTVPSQAVSRNLGGAFVMVVAEDGTVAQTQIGTGISVLGRTVITSGLKEGDMVITEGLNKVRPGVKVNAAPATVPTQTQGQ